MVNLILCFWLVFRNELSGRVLHRLMDVRRQYTAPFVVGFDADLPCFIADHTSHSGDQMVSLYTHGARQKMLVRATIEKPIKNKTVEPTVKPADK